MSHPNQYTGDRPFGFWERNRMLVSIQSTTMYMTNPIVAIFRVPNVPQKFYLL